MTVAQLIARLQRLPQNARVGVSNHDQDDNAGELDGLVVDVVEASSEMKRLRQVGVVIRL